MYTTFKIKSVENLLPWQLQLYKRLKDNPKNLTIIYDTVHNTGKSVFMKWITHNNNTPDYQFIGENTMLLADIKQYMTDYSLDVLI